MTDALFSVYRSGTAIRQNYFQSDSNLMMSKKQTMQRLTRQNHRLLPFLGFEPAAGGRCATSAVAKGGARLGFIIWQSSMDMVEKYLKYLG